MPLFKWNIFKYGHSVADYQVTGDGNHLRRMRIGKKIKND